MKLKTKFLSLLSITILPTTTLTCCLNMTSCGEKYEESTDVDQKFVDYIQQRTFSLMAYSRFEKIDDTTKSMYYLVYGTGWIISDATPSIDNDYCYYVATNWHVIDGIDNLSKTDEPGFVYKETIVGFADNNSTKRSDGIIAIENYDEFSKETYFQPQGKNNFVYLGNDCIDFYVVKCDFRDGRPSIINKLNNLNSFRKENGYINKFVNSDDPNIISKNKYVGGYPYYETETYSGEVYGGKWEVQYVNPTNFSYYPKNSKSHDVDEAKQYLDISPQYGTNVHYKPDWMDGGSSGSMLITEDFEVCGIYWGGQVDNVDNPKWFQPHFSLFKTNDKDFISKWII